MGVSVVVENKFTDSSCTIVTSDIMEFETIMVIRLTRLVLHVVDPIPKKVSE